MIPLPHNIDGHAVVVPRQMPSGMWQARCSCRNRRGVRWSRGDWHSELGALQVAVSHLVIEAGRK